MTTTLGEVRSYADLHGILRARAAELGVTREGLDHIIGLQGGYCAKLLSPTPIKRLGAQTFGPFLEGLGLKLICVVDEEAVARHAAKHERHRAEKVYPLATPKQINAAAKEMFRDLAARGGRKGAATRNARMAPEKRAKLARKAARARWSRMTRRQRVAEIRRLNAARRCKRNGGR